MSDHQQGPDWWLASDGRWYPPQGVPQPPAYQQPASARPISVAVWVALGGAGALFLGALLPWAMVGAFTKNGTEGDGVLTLVGGVVIAALAFASRSRSDTAQVKRLGVAIVIIALLAGAVGIYDLVDIARGADAGAFHLDASPGIGLYLTVLGAGVALVGGVMLLRDGSDAHRGETSGF